MRRFDLSMAMLVIILVTACNNNPVETMEFTAVQTSAEGQKMSEIQAVTEPATDSLLLLPGEEYQTITGIGGAFTESTAYLLNQLSEAKRDSILKAYFSKEGAAYSLTRTHMNSCDFSLGNYSYAKIPGDTNLEHFSIAEDEADIIPTIKKAQEISSEGFKIVASPWTAPPWMKDNNDWNAGSLLIEYYDTWALFFSKYAKAYAEKGIDIWAFTVENEPLGNGANWESMHYTPQQMAEFTKNHLAPRLKQDSVNAKILVYDQNRGEELMDYVTPMFEDKDLLPHIYGTAVHWYTGTQTWFPESLQYLHKLAPKKSIIHTEGCVDAEVPHWNDDAWYWKQEATDWGYDWAKPENKYMHPKYTPVYRYARDIIGCLNNWVEGWIDWNMVLDDKGGPNHAENWCVAPVIVKPQENEVYFTPLYYVMSHFSKYIRPGAKRIGLELSNEELMATAVKNPDGSLAIVVLNQGPKAHNLSIRLNNKQVTLPIGAQALQTISLQP